MSRSTSPAPTTRALTRFVLVVRRWGDRQLPADRLDPMFFTMRVDKRHHHLPRRSSSACAKNADALRKISFARLSSRFSRSNSRNRPRSDVLNPGRSPRSRSDCCTQRRSDSAVQPILLAIDWIAAHCELCSSRCSKTIRTARSLTSAEYRFDVLMTPSSQSMESPGIPGRFRLWRYNDYAGKDYSHRKPSVINPATRVEFDLCDRCLRLCGDKHTVLFVDVQRAKRLREDEVVNLATHELAGAPTVRCR